MPQTAPPRIYCIPATKAPIVAVFRRGPSNWSHVGRWHIEEQQYEPGAWLGGRLFPRRSDVSPDGQYLCYFAHKPSATWDAGEAYIAVSRLPWLTALHVIPTCGTWTRGCHFIEASEPTPLHDLALPFPYTLHPTPAVQFDSERRRGWQETPDCLPKTDPWDVNRNARLYKRQPNGDAVLVVESVGRAGGEFGAEQAIDGMRVSYSMEVDGDIQVLDHLQWADWHKTGQLLTATRNGNLQICHLEGNTLHTVFEQDLSVLAPQPVPAPDWAQHW